MIFIESVLIFMKMLFIQNYLRTLSIIFMYKILPKLFRFL
ncbi:hypothetical protein CLERM_207 [Coxiella-like endosymbiont]|nr:hypothetical protein CLERM_207 [Coxiella-like endosymbiont]